MCTAEAGDCSAASCVDSAFESCPPATSAPPALRISGASDRPHMKYPRPTPAITLAAIAPVVRHCGRAGRARDALRFIDSRASFRLTTLPPGALMPPLAAVSSRSGTSSESSAEYAACTLWRSRRCSATRFSICGSSRMADSTAARAAGSSSPSAYAMRVSSEIVMWFHLPSPTAPAMPRVPAQAGWSAYRWGHQVPPPPPCKAIPRRARD